MMKHATQRFFCLLLFLFIQAASADAAPSLSYIYPAGGQRGTTVKITFAGSGLAQITGFFTPGTGLVAKIEPGTDAGKRTLEIAVASDAPLGIQQVRVYDSTGLSNPRYFCVGDLPEQMEKEPNNTLKDALKVTLPVTVNGRIQEESDVDCVTFHAKPTETIVCEIQAQRILGQIGSDSWLKGYMEIRDAENSVLAENEGTSDEYYRWDPHIFFEAPREGDYTVCYRDLNWRGDERAVYRLTIGVVPHAVGIFPLGGQRGATVDVHFFGPNLQNAVQQIRISADAPDEMQVAYTGPNGTTNVRPFHITDLPNVRQNAPNHTRATAQTVRFPCAINGQIQKDGLRDYYRFHIDKQQHVALEVFSRRVGTPMDSELVLFDAGGQVVDTDDDARGRDSRIEHDLPPGDYTVMIHDVDDRGGEAFSYQLVLTPTRPHFNLTALPDAPKLALGGTTTLNIHLEREDGFDSAVTVTVDGLPQGVTATSLTLPKDKQDGQLTLTARSDSSLGPIRIVVAGTGKTQDRDLKVIARTEETYNIQGTGYQRELIGPILLVTPK